MSLKAQAPALVKVVRADVRVMFMRAGDATPDEIQQAWARLERAVGLRGRKFFGAMYGNHEYRVCSQLRGGDDPEALGCTVGTLPGGKYLSARLQGEPPAVYERIPSMWRELVTQPSFDRSRPTIEFYRRRDIIDLLLPVS